MTRRAPYAQCAAVVFLLATASCTSLASVDVTYRQCVPVDGITYTERFNGTLQELVDCDWKTDQAPDGTKIFLDSGDLVLRPPRGLRWSETTQGPMFFRQMRGDFLVVTRAEATSTIKGDHCLLNHDEGAGLVVRGAQPQLPAWATLLVRPYFDPAIPLEVACKDETIHPPKARAQARTFGFAERKVNEKEVVDVGKDAEAYVALCRQNDMLAYYYGAEGPDPKTPVWEPIYEHAITREPVDVGVTTFGAPFGGDGAGLEGHFTWVVYRDYSDKSVGDGCEGALRTLALPEQE